MTESRSPEKRQIPNITEVENMPFIEGRTCAIRREVVSIDQAAIAAVRGVIDRVAPGISTAECEFAYAAAERSLESVVDGRRLQFEMSNGSVAGKWTKRVSQRVASADT